MISVFSLFCSPEFSMCERSWVARQVRCNCVKKKPLVLATLNLNSSTSVRMSHWPYLIITVKRAFYFVKGGVGWFKDKTNPFNTPKAKEKKLHRAKILTAKKHRFQKLCFNDINFQNTLFVKLLVVSTAISRAFNPWTYTQIHTPTVVQGKRGLMEPRPRLRFWYVAVFRNDFVFSRKPLTFLTR